VALGRGGQGESAGQLLDGGSSSRWLVHGEAAEAATCGAGRRRRGRPGGGRQFR
jgi:hypothetical protein